MGLWLIRMFEVISASIRAVKSFLINNLRSSVRVFVASLVIFFIAGFVFFTLINRESVLSPNLTMQKSLDVIFFDPVLFDVGVKQSLKYPDEPVNAKGIIIPHHTLPSVLISDVFNKVKHKKIKTVVLISPNHYEGERATLLINCDDWVTKFGEVNCDKKLFDKISKVAGVGLMPGDAIQNEHGIAGVVPYLKYYFADAKILPIVVSNKFDRVEAVQKYANDIGALLDQDTLVIGAFDFSHYLTSDQANQMDQLTLALMQNRDYQKIIKLTDDNLDSPVGLVLFFMIMDGLAKGDYKIAKCANDDLDCGQMLHSKFNLIANTNSGYLYNQPNVMTTSYITGWE